METIIFLAVVLFGLIWGSFLNVVIYRLPLGRSLVQPPSTCPKCGSRIKPYDNIPILSYLILGGKCRACGTGISMVYPVVEGLTALIFVLIFLHHGRVLGVPFLASILFASALIALGFIDLFHQILPDEITLPGLVLALVYAAFRTDLGLRLALIGAAAGAGFLLLVYIAYFFLRRREGLGMGDVTFMLMIGAFLGPWSAALTLILASLAGTLAGLSIILVRKKDLQFLLPFGSFLAPAALVSLLWGETIIKAYLGLFRS